jgi:hypothetical protein
MPDQPQDLAPGLLRREWEHLSAIERRVMDHVAHRKPIARDTNHEFSETRSIGDRMSDRIAAFGGSWPFVLGFVACLVGWVLLNSWILRRGSPFDPYPYILLNLVLSTVAALQAPVILMAQNRDRGSGAAREAGRSAGTRLGGAGRDAAAADRPPRAARRCALRGWSAGRDLKQMASHRATEATERKAEGVLRGFGVPSVLSV